MDFKNTSDLITFTQDTAKQVMLHKGQIGDKDTTVMAVVVEGGTVYFDIDNTEPLFFDLDGTEPLFFDIDSTEPLFFDPKEGTEIGLDDPIWTDFWM